MTRRLLLTTGIGFIVLLLAITLLLASVIGTQTGSRLLWRGLASAVDGLAAESIQGRIGSSLSLEGLQYETDSLRLYIGSTQLQWAPMALLGGEFRLLKLQLADVSYTQLAAPPPADDSPPFRLPERFTLPLALDLRAVVLRAFEYRAAADSAPLRIDEASLAATFRGTELSLDRLDAHGPLFSAEATAHAHTRDTYPLSASLDWRLTAPELAPIDGMLSVEGDLTSLRLEQSIEAPYRSSQQIVLRDLPGAMDLDLRVDVDDARWPAGVGGVPATTLAGTLLADGGLDDLGYEADLTADVTGLGTLALLVRGRFSDQVAMLDQLRLSREPGAAVLEATGRAELAGTRPALALRGEWEGLSWPLAGDPRINSSSGEFSVTGHTEDYAVELSAALAVPGQTGGQLSLSGQGGSEAFELADLQLTLLEGSLAGHGELRWSPELQGSIMLDGDGLDPAVLAPAYPGKLTLVLRADGGIREGSVQARVDTLAVKGRLREQLLTVQAAGAFQDSQLSVETLAIEAGATQLNASGQVGDTLDLQWDVDSPDLGQLVPGAAGSLAGRGNLEGRPALPAVSGSLQGVSIAYEEYGLESLALELDVDLERKAPSKLTLAIGQAQLGGMAIDHLDISAAGTRGDHDVTVQLDSSAGAAQMTLTGGLRDQLWHGALTAGELQYRELAPWVLAAQQPLQLGTDAQRLDRGCWESGEARLCLEGQRAGADAEAALALDRFELAYLRPLFPPSISLAGRLDAQVRLRQEAGATPELETTVKTDGVELSTAKTAERPDELLLGLRPSEVRLNYGEAGLQAKLSMPFVAGGGIEASAQVGSGSPPLMERPLQGKLDLALDDIALLATLSPEIEQATGALNGAFEVAGTLAEPLPEGELRLDGGSLALLGPGLNVNNIDLAVSGNDGAGLDFEGRAISGEGALRLDGSAQLDGPRTTATLALEGDSFEIVNTVAARVFVSPELQLSVNETGIAITGEVLVPRAEITPKELPKSVVMVSDDEVIISDERDGGVAAAAQRELDARIRIILGDAVTVDGFGFEGRLDGALTVTQKPGQPTLGSGELNILNGQYRAYGQGLVIDTGKILFAGGPIDEPGINVRALRRPDEEIVVGVSVRGPLQNPDFKIFSEPGMSQAEQLSWLVLGRPLQGVSEGEGDMIAQAAMALGLRGGNVLADRFRDDLGVDSIGFETGSGEAGAASDVNQAALVIGKYLSPELYISYGIGLFDSVSTVSLEYSLSDHWKISTQSSTLSSGGDVSYTIER
jgi:translocation and assembly module TamB